MRTGGGILLRGELRADTCPGEFIPEFVASTAPSLMAGAWLDAPDSVPAGSTRREEIWRGLTGEAWPQSTVALRDL